MTILQPGEGRIDTDIYLASDLSSCSWGYLPNRDSAPALTVPDGSIVTVDTVSHEGVLEDQGRDPVSYFGMHGVPERDVLRDARTIAESDIVHGDDDGPHVVTGPIAVAGARPGQVLRVDVLDLRTRVPYGVVSNRHGYGALPGEFPEHPDGDTGDDPSNVSHFVTVDERAGRLVGVLTARSGRRIRFPLNPFMGVMGVAPDTSEPVHSVPPGPHGGNIDVNLLGVGSSLYLPIQAEGALFYVGDPHYAQGDGEVALTALEAPLRGVFKLSIVPEEEVGRVAPELPAPIGETDDAWIPMGLHQDLGEAMKAATRSAIRFLEVTQDLDRATALSYLSAAADFEVSQVVDGVKGVHCVIRKSDFADW